MKKIKPRKKYSATRKTIEKVGDMVPFAWEFGLEVPRKAMSHDDMAIKYPHLMMLFALHEGQIKSHAAIKINADILKSYKAAELQKMSKEQFVEAGVQVVISTD